MKKRMSMFEIGSKSKKSALSSKIKKKGNIDIYGGVPMENRL